MLIYRDDFYEVVRPHHEQRGVVFTIRSCIDALVREPDERTEDDITLTLAIVSAMGNGLFKTLPLDKRRRLARALTLAVVPKGTTVCRQGQPGNTFYVIFAGAVDVYVKKTPSQNTYLSSTTTSLQHTIETKEDKESIGDKVHLLQNGDCFGEQSLLYNAPRSATCVAHENTRLLVLCKADFDQVAGENLVLAPRLSLEILKIPAQERTEQAMRYLYNFCRSFRFFRKLQPTTLRTLLAGLKYVEVPKHEVVYGEGEDNASFYTIYNGSVHFLQRNNSTQSMGNPAASKEDDHDVPGYLQSLHGRCEHTLRKDDTFGDYECDQPASFTGGMYSGKGRPGGKRKFTSIAGADGAGLIVMHQTCYLSWLQADRESRMGEAFELLSIEQCRRAISRRPPALRTPADIETIHVALRRQTFVAQLPRKKEHAFCREVGGAACVK